MVVINVTSILLLQRKLHQHQVAARPGSKSRYEDFWRQDMINPPYKMRFKGQRLFLSQVQFLNQVKVISKEMIPSLQKRYF